MKKLKKAIISLILTAFILTGCSSKTEVRDRAFVQAVAVENNNDYVEVTVKLFDESDSYTGEGSDFFSAVNNAELKQDKKFFTGHMEFILSANEDNRIMLENIIKSNKIPPSCFLVYNENAGKFIENLDCDKFSGIFKIRYENDKALKKDIWNIVEGINSNGYCSVDCIQGNNSFGEINIK